MYILHTFSYQNLLEDCVDKDVFGLFSMNIAEDDKNSSVNILQVSYVQL